MRRAAKIWEPAARVNCRAVRLTKTFVKRSVTFAGVGVLLSVLVIGVAVAPSWSRASDAVRRSSTSSYPQLLRNAVLAAETNDGRWSNTFAVQLAKLYGARAFAPSRHLTYQVRESALAAVISLRYSHDDILTAYLDHVFMGRGVEGIENGSQAYFGKSTEKLSAAECAFLAGIIRSPALYLREPNRARDRRNAVLHRMLQNGAIDQATYASGIAEGSARQPNSAQKLPRPALSLGASAPRALRSDVPVRYSLGTGRAA